MDQELEWFKKARYKFIWDKNTIEKYIVVFSELIKDLISENGLGKGLEHQYISPNIGLFSVHASNSTLFGYALYIAAVRLKRDRRQTLYSVFKSEYRMAVFSDDIYDLMGLRDKEMILKYWTGEQGDRITSRVNERSKLVLEFQSIANRSLNHRRKISPKIRFLVLQRDSSTCQICGRKAPEVKLHLDHKTPVSFDKKWWISDNPDDYQTLCEECNLGKGDLSWLMSS